MVCMELFEKISHLQGFLKIIILHLKEQGKKDYSRVQLAKNCKEHFASPSTRIPKQEQPHNRQDNYRD